MLNKIIKALAYFTMTAIIYTCILLLLYGGEVEAQYLKKLKFGNTYLTDSAGATTNWYKISSNVYMLDSCWIGRWLTVGKTSGGIRLDTNGAGKIYYDGFNMILENRKTAGYIMLIDYGTNQGIELRADGTGGIQNYWIGEGNTKFYWYKTSGGSGLPIATLDSTGFNLLAGNFKKNGTVLNFAYRDSSNLYTGVNNFRDYLLLTGGGGDTVKFDIYDNDLIITPNGAGSITLGTNAGTGTKSLYAGSYYTGSTLGYLSSSWGSETESSEIYFSTGPIAYVGVAAYFRELTINGVTVKVLVQDETGD